MPGREAYWRASKADVDHPAVLADALEVEIADRLAGQKVHVSFDIDVLDPAFAPGTEIPSPGGLSTREALDLLRAATVGSTLVGSPGVTENRSSVKPPPSDRVDDFSTVRVARYFAKTGATSP